MNRVLPILWIWIISVCAHDVYLTALYANDMRFNEENPVGMALIRYGGGSPALFLSLKWVANLFMMLILVLLYKAWPEACRVATVAVSIVQVVFLWVLWR